MNLAIERRRKSFRHKIRPSIVIRVEIFVHGRPIGAGRIADISLGGMGLLLNRWSNSLTRTCTVRFHLPGEWRQFELDCEVVHRLTNDDGLFWGLAFVDIEQPWNELQQIALSQFLLAEYRKQRELVNSFDPQR